MGSCCCGHLKVSPAPWDDRRSHMVEVRHKRILRIQHINPRERDKLLEREIEMYLQYQKQGLTSVGPMAIPKKQQVNINPHISGKKLTSQDQPGVPLMQTNLPETSPTEDRSLLLSASGVEVKMNMTTPNQPKENTNIPNTNTTVSKPVPLRGQTPSVSNQKDSNVVLFFIHGVGGSSDIWRAQLNFFAHLGYEVVAPDLIGHGLSCGPREAKHYHFDQICADLEEVFDRYCKRKNVVIGHSYGSSFASVLARQRSKWVTKLVMISGGGPIPLAPQPGVFSLPVSILSCLRPCVECKYKKSAFSGKEPLMSPKEAFAVPTYVLSHTMNGQDWADGDELYHNWITCPTLLIYGKEDKLITLKEEEDMKEALCQSELEVIEGTSHMVMIEDPHQVNKLIYSFLLRYTRLEGTSTLPNEEPERSKSRSSIRSTKSNKSIPNL